MYIRNPSTNRRIKVGGRTYKRLMKTGLYTLSLGVGDTIVMTPIPVYTPPPPPPVYTPPSPLENLLINRFIGDLGKQLYYAKFLVINPKRYHTEEFYIIRWKEITPGERGQMLRLYDGMAHPLGDFNSISITWDWNEKFEQMQSAEAIKVFIELFQKGEGPTTVRRNAGDIRLSEPGINQPTVGGNAGMYLQGGDICKPEHYRENSCMINLFLNDYYDDIKTFRSDLTHEKLYELATTKKYGDEQIHSISLNEAKNWSEKWKFRIMAIDRDGRLIFEHTPTTVSKKLSSSVWRLMVHNSHVWGIKKNVKSFTKIYRSVEADSQAPVYDHDISDTMSDRWWHPPVPDNETPPTFISDLNEIFDVDEDVTNIITNMSIPKLFTELWELDIEPGGIKLNYGVVDSFNIRIERGDSMQLLRISSAINREAADDQCVVPAVSARAQVVFDNAIYKGRSQFQPKSAMSRYSDSISEAFQCYGRGPRMGTFQYDSGEDCGMDNVDMLKKLLGDSAIPDDTDEKQECTEYDVSRAYTGFLSEIKSIPVFSVCDDLIEVDEHDPVVLADSFYLIHTELYGLERAILFDSEYDFVTGETLIFARSQGIKYKVLGVAHPSRHVNIDGAKIIREIYENPELADPEMKTVANIVYGLCNKLYGRVETASCFLNKVDAQENGGRLLPIGPGYLSVKNGKKLLSEGYKPLGAIILNKMRIMLYRMCKALGQSALGVRTDAVYSSHPNGRKMLKAAGFQFLDGHQGFDKILKLKTKKMAIPDLPKLARTHSILLDPVQKWDTVRLSLKNELATMDGDWSEVDKIMDMGNIAIEATVPGAGKTYTALRYLERKGVKNTSLIVCPWNSLASVIQQEGFNAITLHKLLGRGIDDGVVNQAYDLGDITHIHFEEVYLHDITAVGWMYKFMRKNRRIKYSMTGDPGQISPPNQELSIDSDHWYEQAFSKMFRVRLVLKISKRVKTERERDDMARLCDELRAENNSVKNIMRMHASGWSPHGGIRMIDFSELTDEDAKYPHIAATNATVARVNDWAHPIVFDEKTAINGFNIDEHLLGAQTKNVATGRINRNASYHVTAVDDTFVTVVSATGKESKIRLTKADSMLVRPYCRTGHSTQGISLGDKIYIHDIESHMVDHRWMRTAVSRCSTLNITIVTASNILNISGAKCERLASATQAFDRQNNIQCTTPITASWIKTTMKKSHYKCACGSLYTNDWSIGKHDQDKPFSKRNTKIMCEKC